MPVLVLRSDIRALLAAHDELENGRTEALGELSVALENPTLSWNGDETTMADAIIRFAVKRLNEYPMKRTWDAEARSAAAERVVEAAIIMRRCYDHDEGRGMSAEYMQACHYLRAAVDAWRGGTSDAG
jgi:hypothetical protein